MTGNHEIVARTGTLVQLRRKTKDICPIHKTTEITLYCNDCDIECCLSCLEDAHQRHSVVAMEKILSEAARSLKSQIAKLEDVTIPRLRENLNLYNSDSTTFQEHAKIAKEALEEERKECMRMINEIYDEKLESFDLCVGKAKTQIESKISDSKMKVKDLRDTLYSDRLEIIQAYKQSGRPQYPFNCFHKDVPCFRFLYPTFKKGESHDYLHMRWGNFETTEIDAQVLKTFQAPSSHIYVRSGVSEDIWVGHTNFHIFDQLGNEKEEFKPNEINVQDFFVTKADEIYFTDLHFIAKYTRDGSISTLVSAPSSFWIKGICINKKQDIVACMHACNNEGNHLAVYSSDDFRKIQEIKKNEDDNSYQGLFPEKVRCNGEDYCVAEGNGISVFSASGNLRWEYFINWKQDNYCRHPYSVREVCCDKLQNILVLDNRNKCIHYLDKNGQFLGFLVTRKQHGVEHFMSLEIINEILWVLGNASQASESQVAIVKYFR